MATFKETFAAKRKELGAGKTFTWNGKSYTTDYATDKKSAPTASDKPKAKPAGLNPQSGAAQSGTAGKVKPFTKPSGFKGKFNDPKSGYTYQNLPGKGRDTPKVAPATSGASRSTAGKVAPKMSMMDKAKADATAARDKAKASNKPKTPATPAKSDAAYTSKIGPKRETTFERMKRALTTKGGFSKFKG
jgi:hypothetical protein